MSLAQLVKQDEIAILLIEDASGDAAAISKAIIHGESHYSFRITRKVSLKEGLEYLNMARVDVVLLDLGLPDAKGLKAVNEVHQAFPGLPIVIISGYSNIDIIHEALQSGAQEFLVKGECSGAVIRQSMYQAIARKKIELSYQRGDKL